MTTERDRAKVVIIGSGPAGYTAAVYTARAALQPMMIRGLQPGGQLTITTDVENWPGETSIMGPELMEKMEAQARSLGTDIVDDIVTDVDLSSRPYRLTLESGREVLAETLVIATGAQARWLGLESETKYRGFGVSACATCDGFFYRGKAVAVVGGGNTAVEEALFLTNFASKVYLIHRRDELRADKTNQARLFANEKVEPVWNATVSEVLGQDDPLGVTGVKLAATDGGEDRELEIDGLFIAIGHDPATQLFRGKLDMDESGYLLCKPDSTATSAPGVYAAGDVKDHVYRQAVTAAGMGCMAALEAERFLAANEEAEPQRQAAE
ncbi:thioredoxin-disulfide reductase [Pacificimonas flava]|uniref:Thioredoxin reductase n=2 Tax=Pacificimonas TaxID=1960290 RepID=A0A219B9L5_9SPHN|nr:MULTISPECIES: thioredoxin-disulfide reductase [Pacificimonas]MBZ6379945.1 thioredoxin-disulfide reductase [Pacificimonas aurantium]OWV34468.1 thioredoxin-disulfide reductase [Pacificimonas flava]